MYLFTTIVLPCDKVEFVDTGACIPVLVSNCLPSTVIDRRFGLQQSRKRIKIMTRFNLATAIEAMADAFGREPATCFSAVCRSCNGSEESASCIAAMLAEKGLSKER